MGFFELLFWFGIGCLAGLLAPIKKKKKTKYTPAQRAWFLSEVERVDKEFEEQEKALGENRSMTYKDWEGAGYPQELQEMEDVERIKRIDKEFGIDGDENY